MSEEKDAKAKGDPHTWTYSFSVTVTPPTACDEDADSETRRLFSMTRREIILAVAALLLVAVEPWVLWWAVFRDDKPRRIEESMIVQPLTPAPKPAGTKRRSDYKSDVITPLDVRDPSALVIGPGP